MSHIRIDKIAGPPPHALTPEEVKALLAVVPEEWGSIAERVHLKATLPEHAHHRFERPVIYSAYSRELRVCCRGLDPDTARREILREIAIEGLRLRTRQRNRLPEAELKRVDLVVDPLLER